ncbi:MAG: glycoside hydrolase [Flavobacteriales bacterium]
MEGVAGRSVTALDRAGNQFVYDRFEKCKGKDINSYFLDFHVTGDALYDYSSVHSQTVFDARRIRDKYLKYFSKQGFVLWLETVCDWSLFFLSFFHGIISTFYDLH